MNAVTGGVKSVRVAEAIGWRAAGAGSSAHVPLELWMTHGPPLLGSRLSEPVVSAAASRPPAAPLVIN